MSRINKYRGVCIDYQEWVYGDLMQFSDTSIICVGDISKDSHFKGKCHCDVYPETVGQYIGVDDKNGKEIYEWDIVKRKMFDDYVIGQVVWVDVGFCGFMLKCGNSYYHIGKSEHAGISDCDEVIGNVYENLDLLKGQEMSKSILVIDTPDNCEKCTLKSQLYDIQYNLFWEP